MGAPLPLDINPIGRGAAHPPVPRQLAGSRIVSCEPANLPANPFDQLGQAFSNPGRHRVLARVVAQGICTPTTQLAGFPITQTFAYFNGLLVSGIVTV